MNVDKDENRELREGRGEEKKRREEKQSEKRRLRKVKKG